MQGATNEGVKIRIGNEGQDSRFLQLQIIWKSRKSSQRTNIRIFNSNVKYFIVEIRRITKATATKVQTFINSCLRSLHWPEKISSVNLCRERTQQIPAEQEMGRRKWGWRKHILRKLVASTTRQALSWNLQYRGKGKEAGRETPGAETS